MYEEMTAGEALAWHATRDEAFAAQNRNQNAIGLTIALAWRHAHLANVEKSFAPAPDVDASKLALVIACRVGEISATGFRQASGTGAPPTHGTSEPISVADWGRLWLADRGGKESDIIAVPEPKEGRRQEYFTDWHFLRFPRDQVLAAFPARAGVVEAVSAWPAATVAEGPLLRAAIEVNAIPRAPTPGEIEAAYREWIGMHEGQPPPSRTDDEDYLKQKFPGLTKVREHQRSLRARLAPAIWTGHGRRPDKPAKKLAQI
jgi:hypothetical protein